MSRSETTAMLSENLEGLVLSKYPLWASEVKLNDGELFADAEKKGRVDYMAFEPLGMSHSIRSIEAGLVHAFEVKSCMADLNSGHGLNRVGDVNWLVMTKELHEELIDKEIDTSGWNRVVWGIIDGRFAIASARAAYKTSRKMPTSQALWMMLTASQRFVVRGVGYDR